MRPRVVHWRRTWHHPVAVDAVAACVDVHVEQLLMLMLMSTAVAAGPTGIATAGIAGEKIGLKLRQLLSELLASLRKGLVLLIRMLLVIMLLLLVTVKLPLQLYLCQMLLMF